MNEELELLGLWVSCVKTNTRAFNDILDAAILSVPVCGEDVEVTERFTYLGSETKHGKSRGCKTRKEMVESRETTNLSAMAK